MLDSLNRDINYMRISITDRCNFSCSYCRVDISKHLKHEDILTYEEILQVCKSAIKLGICNFKITGGEPTVRRNYIHFIQQLKQLNGVGKVTMTSNGFLLNEDDLKQLKVAGIDGINFSIDTLNPSAYFNICHVDALGKVLENLNLAYAMGIKVKVNVVVDASFTLERMKEMMTLMKDKEIPVRFIEQMSMGYRANCSKIEEIKDAFFKEFSCCPIDKKLGQGPAHYYQVEGYKGYVGFIEAIHHKFCSTCNRVRLSSVGDLKLCLYHKDSLNLKAFIGNPKELEKMMQQAIYHKPKEHHFEDEKTNIQMNDIGG